MRYVKCRSVLLEVWQAGVYKPLYVATGDQGRDAFWAVGENMTPSWGPDPMLMFVRIEQAAIDGDWANVFLRLR